MTGPVTICPVCGYKGPKLDDGYCPNAVSIYGNPVTVKDHVVARMPYIGCGLVDPFRTVEDLAYAVVFYESYFGPHQHDTDMDDK